jgi:hypothetical protein
MVVRPIAAGPEASGNLFRREGDYWTVRYQGSVARLKDAKGLRYLAQLLGNPGREYHAVDLAADRQTARSAPPAGRAWADGELRVRPDLGDAGALLDAQAKAAYQARLGELTAELEEADRCNEPGRAATAAAERDFLIGELARAVGPGGRDRRAASHAERARLNVTRAIRAAMANLARATTLAAAACSHARRSQRPVPSRGDCPVGLAAAGLPPPTDLRRAASSRTTRSTTAPTESALTSAGLLERDPALRSVGTRPAENHHSPRACMKPGMREARGLLHAATFSDSRESTRCASGRRSARGAEPDAVVGDARICG